MFEKLMSGSGRSVEYILYMVSCIGDISISVVTGNIFYYVLVYLLGICHYESMILRV